MVSDPTAVSPLLLTKTTLEFSERKCVRSLGTNHNPFESILTVGFFFFFFYFKMLLFVASPADRFGHITDFPQLRYKRKHPGFLIRLDLQVPVMRSVKSNHFPSSQIILILISV